MFAYDELKERIPEPKEEMVGIEALNYLKDKTRPKGEINSDSLVVDDILSKTNFCSGSILDVGCGCGGLLREFKKANPKLKLMGIDASTTLLNAAPRTLK